MKTAHFTGLLLLPLALLAGCERNGPIPNELASSYAPAFDVVCENYGGMDGTWTKCLFKNKTEYAVSLNGLESVCYKGQVKTGGRPLGGVVDPHGQYEDSLICGGAGISRVVLKERG